MNTTDYTLTSPLSASTQQSRPLLALTIVWHPDTTRIGEQFIDSGAQTENTIELGRFSPLFRPTLGDALPIGYSGVSREPTRIVRMPNDQIKISPPTSRMIVEVNGQVIEQAIELSPEQVEAGVIIGLGRTIFVCLHWMRCLPKHNPVVGFIGVSSAAIMTRDLIRLAACNQPPVLLLGETGTGKEVAAQAIHNLSPRATHKMISVNMAALNESLAAADLFGASKGAYTGAQSARNGFFFEAQNSTLFLDEIGNTPSAVQPMLLRVLETNEYRPLGASRDQNSTARLITATDQDLYHSSFNHALVRRLESFVIRIPPLRARREDIGLLILHVLKHNQVDGISAAQLPTHFISEMLNFEWPGNIRQLANVFKRALLSLQMGEQLQLARMVETPRIAATDSAALRQISSVNNTLVPPLNPFESTIEKPAVERKKLRDLTEDDVISALNRHQWTIQYAADELGISRPSMYKLIEANRQIRRVEQIPFEEIKLQLNETKNNVEQCAALLKTPSEALRRHLRGLGVLN